MKSKIYGVMVGQYSDQRILAVTHNEKLAERWVEALKNDCQDGYCQYNDIRVCTVDIIPNKPPFKDHYWGIYINLWDAGRNNSSSENLQAIKTEAWAIDMWPERPLKTKVTWVRAPCHQDKVTSQYIGCRLEVIGPLRENVIKVAKKQLALWKSGAKIKFRD